MADASTTAFPPTMPGAAPHPAGAELGVGAATLIL